MQRKKGCAYPILNCRGACRRQEEREACRALKGAVLRQEVFALDDTPKANTHHRHGAGLPSSYPAAG